MDPVVTSSGCNYYKPLVLLYMYAGVPRNLSTDPLVTSSGCNYYKPLVLL